MTTNTALNIIAKHPTERGWSIMIDLTSEGYKYPVYQVSSVHPDGTYLPFTTERTEDAARAEANKLWLRMMGREPKMIGYGGPAL
jgi:hypothetical protein